MPMRSANVNFPEACSKASDASVRGDTDRILVSVVIPTYNCARYIGDALKSVAMQSYSDIEIVVVDDGSDDKTQDAIAASGVSCRYVLNERKKGPSGARNQGIEMCSGQFIAFLDADDGWLPNKLAVQIPALQADATLSALGGRMVPWEGDAVDARFDSEIRRYSFDEMIVRNRLCTPTVVVRRDAIDRVGWFDEDLKLSEDFELWLRLSKNGTVARVETPLARFRQRSEGLSAGNRDRTFALDIRFTRSLIDRYKDVPNISRLVKQGIAAREFERAIELCDVEMRYRDAFIATVNSIRSWPWNNPITPDHPLTRLRRLRRIALNAMNRAKQATAPSDAPNGRRGEYKTQQRSLTS